MAYVKTIWENLPSESTPINASNLNKIENGIYDNSVNIDNINGELDTLTTYSTDEQVIGTWVDNKPIYRKCFYVSSFPNNTESKIDVSTSNIDFVVKLYGFAKTDIAGNKINGSPINGSRYNASYGTFDVFLDNDEISIVTGMDRTNYYGYIILEYTKRN